MRTTGAERLPFFLACVCFRKIVSMHYARLQQRQSCKVHAPEIQLKINLLKNMELLARTLLACDLQSLE